MALLPPTTVDCHLASQFRALTHRQSCNESIPTEIQRSSTRLLCILVCQGSLCRRDIFDCCHVVEGSPPSDPGQQSKETTLMVVSLVAAATVTYCVLLTQ